MTKIQRHVKEKLSRIPRKYHHPFIHHVHRKHGISRKTLFYMKEYGPRSHVTTVIVRESIKILILAAIISSIGGIALKSVESRIVVVAPLVVLIPALNNLVGSFGTLISSKFTTMLYTGRISFAKNMKHLILIMLVIALISAVYLGIVSVAVGTIYGYPFTYSTLLKIVSISVVATMLLVAFISLASIVIGVYVYKKNEDPNNFLIPISTSIADIGSMLIITFMVLLFF